jgi:hypothetical protein
MVESNGSGFFRLRPTASRLVSCFTHVPLPSRRFPERMTEQILKTEEVQWNKNVRVLRQAYHSVSGVPERCAASVGFDEMKKLPLERRLEFWKYQSALLTFENAREVAGYLIEHSESPLAYQLMTSLYVLYGRPFKQRKQIRVPEELVPSEYAEEHRLLIGLRDKLFAHIDTDGLPDCDISHLTKILVRVDGGRVVGGMASLFPSGFRYEKIRDLCQDLHRVCHGRADDILVDAMGDCWTPPNLTYEIDLRPGDHYLIRQAEWKKGSRLLRIARTEESR